MTTIPRELYLSCLPSGERELSCHVALEGTRAASISWGVRQPERAGESIETRRPLSEREVRRGFASISAILSQDWSDAELHITVGTTTSTHEVRTFEQREPFVLPLRGETLVVGGHRLGEPHRDALAIPSQQFAWDLVGLVGAELALLKAGRGAALRATDFACFGQDVLAPGAGIVAIVVDEFPDADLLVGPEAQTDTAGATGNYVVIAHASGVHSCLAHLQAGSVSVAVGDRVAAGATVGRLGCSGNASGPHLHLHFMDGPDVGTAQPLPVRLTIEGATVAPTSGQLLSS